MKKYLCDVTKPLIILGTGVVLTLLSLCVRIWSEDLAAFLFVLGMGALFIIIGVVYTLSAGSAFKECSAEWEQKNLTQDVVDDFQESAEQYEGQVRLGNKFMFVRGSGIAVAYGDIRQMTIEEEKDKKGCVYIYLYIAYAGGRTLKILRSRGHGKARALQSILDEIQRRDPSVRVG